MGLWEEHASIQIFQSAFWDWSSLGDYNHLTNSKYKYDTENMPTCPVNDDFSYFSKFLEWNGRILVLRQPRKINRRLLLVEIEDKIIS